MIRGLSEYEKYLLIRPVIGGCELDQENMPIIKKPSHIEFNWEELQAIQYKNLSAKHNNSHNLALMFQFDKVIQTLWNHPLKRIALFKTCAAISTPDYSIYPTMNPNDIRYHIYQSRWLGCTWQNYGCTVFPTVGWSTSDTYDLCFSGIEPGCPVVISTLGCLENTEIFLSGFNEMKQILSPPIIIVYGRMIRGMTGTFINFSYKDTFSNQIEQIRMSEISKVFTIKEVA